MSVALFAEKLERCVTSTINEASQPTRFATGPNHLILASKLEDGRRVKFIYKELPEDGAFITAQLEGSEVVYSVVPNKAGNTLSRKDVESHFKGELSKK